MTRQTDRQYAREVAKAEFASAKMEARKTAKRSLLERQTVREKAGAYTSRSVAAAISPSRSRVTTRKVKKGVAFGRILTSEIFGGREFSFHATKGWRSHRAA